MNPLLMQTYDGAGTYYVAESPLAGDQQTESGGQFTGLKDSASATRDFAVTVQGVAKTIGDTASAIGYAVGSAKGAAKQAEVNYQNAKIISETPSLKSRLVNWWLTSTDTDKITVGIGVAGLLLAAAAIYKAK